MTSILTISLVRKPVSEANVAQNVITWGSGALHIEATRIGTTKRAPTTPSHAIGTVYKGGIDGTLRNQTGNESGFNPNIGRWPSNLIMTHKSECELIGMRCVKGIPANVPIKNNSRDKGYAGGWSNIPTTNGFGDADGIEMMQDWCCIDGCSVLALRKQSGMCPSGGTNSQRTHDTGTAARYFPQFKG